MPPTELRPWEQYELEYCVLVGTVLSNCNTTWCTADALPNANTTCLLAGLEPSTTYRVTAVAYQGTATRSLPSNPSTFTTLAIL